MKIQMISKWRQYNEKDDDRYRRIPERVLNAITSQQDASEKLVGWVQLAVIIFFGLLYVVSPKTFSRQMTFEPVPWFVAVFLGVTIIRLYLPIGDACRLRCYIFQWLSIWVCCWA